MDVLFHRPANGFESFSLFPGVCRRRVLRPAAFTDPLAAVVTPLFTFVIPTKAGIHGGGRGAG
jgi:hypothetical protein